MTSIKFKRKRTRAFAESVGFFSSTIRLSNGSFSEYSIGDAYVLAGGLPFFGDQGSKTVSFVVVYERVALMYTFVQHLPQMWMRTTLSAWLWIC